MMAKWNPAIDKEIAKFTNLNVNFSDVSLKLGFLSDEGDTDAGFGMSAGMGTVLGRGMRVLYGLEFPEWGRLTVRVRFLNRYGYYTG